MTAINLGFNSRPVRKGRSLLALAALVGLFPLASCGESDSAPSTLRGERSGQRGAPCVTFMDCVAELECVDGRCGIFGESPNMSEPGTCPPGPEQGDGQQSNPGGETPGGTPGAGTSGGNPGVGTTTTTGGGAPATTGAPSTTTGGGGPGPDDSSSSDTTPTVPLGCEKVAKEYQLVNPFKVGDQAIIDAGALLYDDPTPELQSCAADECHAPMGLGNADPATALNTQKIKDAPGCVLLEAILEGVKKPNKSGKLRRVMPAYKGEMSIEDAWKIVIYMRSL